MRGSAHLLLTPDLEHLCNKSFEASDFLPVEEVEVQHLRSAGMSQRDVTQLLRELNGGNRGVLNQLLPLVYDELRRLAHHQLRSERDGHTLSTTALVHEAYLKMVDQSKTSWTNRAQFMALASQAMRRILVDYARKRKAEKRGGGEVIQLSFSDSMQIMSEVRAEGLVALDESLSRLSGIDKRQSKIVECRYFGGLSIEDTAEALGISSSTVKREWNMAKAWLFRDMNTGQV